MSINEPLVQQFTFDNEIHPSPNGKRDIHLEIPQNDAPGIYLLDADQQSKCCGVDIMVHYSFVIFTGAIAYMTGFLTCFYIW